jgi:MFS family permease
MFGSVWGTLAVNVLVIIGSLLTAIAGKYTSFPLMIVGRVIFGIGSGLIVSVVDACWLVLSPLLFSHLGF